MIGDTGRLSHLTVYRNPRFGCIDELRSTADIKQNWLPVVAAPARANIILEGEAKSTYVRPEARSGKKLLQTYSFAGGVRQHSPYRMELISYVLLVVALGGTCCLLTALLIHLLSV
jgi:hypothetical protein